MNIKLILYGIALAALIGFGLYASHVYNEAKRVPALVQTINVMQQNEKLNNEVSKGYQDELTRLRNHPSRVVRVCKPRMPPPVASSGIDGSSTPGGELPQSSGPDIGQDLYSEADRADALAAQLRAIQERLSTELK